MTFIHKKKHSFIKITFIHKKRSFKEDASLALTWPCLMAISRRASYRDARTHPEKALGINKQVGAVREKEIVGLFFLSLRAQFYSRVRSVFLLQL